MTLHLAAFAAGFILDLLLGDPLGRFHIVVGIGRLVTLLEGWVRRVFPKSRRGELAGGAAVVLLVCALSLGGSLGLLALAYRLHPGLGLGLESFLCWQCLAARDLCRESMAVCRHAERGDLPGAREAVGRIVGRDTAGLDLEGVCRACVETVAENTSDGVITPMLYLAVGGAPLGVLYKAVNTMDSMLGYKNDRYLYFGRAAARLDDAANYIPARAAALCLILAAALCGMDAGNAWRVFRRDRYNHASPNSAQTESACAGALHLRLGGPASYFGKRVEKPFIGDDDRPVEPGDIRRADRLMLWGSLCCFAAAVLVKGGLLLC